MKVEFKTGDRVRPKSENDAFAIACGFVTNPDSPITTDTEFEVAVVVVEGITHNNVKESGLIIVPIGERNDFVWPYVWDFNRFVKVEL